MQQLQRIIIDLAGIFLMVLSPFIGIVPGPGGIVIFLAGLWLLSLNHAWAARWRNKIKEKGMNMVTILFVDNPWLKAFYDLLAVVLVYWGIYILNTRIGQFPATTASFLNVVGLLLFLLNRQRVHRLAAVINKYINKQR